MELTAVSARIEALKVKIAEKSRSRLFDEARLREQAFCQSPAYDEALKVLAAEDARQGGPDGTQGLRLGDRRVRPLNDGWACDELVAVGGLAEWRKLFWSRNRADVERRASKASSGATRDVDLKV
jgi:hypothetical protein